MVLSTVPAIVLSVFYALPWLTLPTHLRQVGPCVQCEWRPGAGCYFLFLREGDGSIVWFNTLPWPHTVVHNSLNRLIGLSELLLPCSVSTPLLLQDLIMVREVVSTSRTFSTFDLAALCLHRPVHLCLLKSLCSPAQMFVETSLYLLKLGWRIRKE